MERPSRGLDFLLRFLYGGWPEWGMGRPDVQVRWFSGWGEVCEWYGRRTWKRQNIILRRQANILTRRTSIETATLRRPKGIPRRRRWLRGSRTVNQLRRIGNHERLLRRNWLKRVGSLWIEGQVGQGVRRGSIRGRERNRFRTVRRRFCAASSNREELRSLRASSWPIFLSRQLRNFCRTPYLTWYLRWRSL
jgi:hypothetical protein